ncbi:hypothetical protein [Halorubrum sp. DTA46]|uniref:hypothetical protein n=1 Tax=Halorubrum sp. DTA46 TaxID=3402162 RepID=UPI003AACBADA
MCHHNVETRSIEEIRERHRSGEADERLDESPHVEVEEEPADDAEPPAEPRTPADD